MKEINFVEVGEIKGINHSCYVLSERMFKTLSENVKIPDIVIINFKYDGILWYAIEAKLIEKHLPVNFNI